MDGFIKCDLEVNDGSFITIAYDNGPISPKPTCSRVGRIVVLAVILGGIGQLESFLLYRVRRQGLRVPLEISQTCLYLNLAVGEVHTLYAVRTSGPFWTLRHAAALEPAGAGDPRGSIAFATPCSGFLLQDEGTIWGPAIHGRTDHPDGDAPPRRARTHHLCR